MINPLPFPCRSMSNPLPFPYRSMPKQYNNLDFQRLDCLFLLTGGSHQKNCDRKLSFFSLFPLLKYTLPVKFPFALQNIRNISKLQRNKSLPGISYKTTSQHRKTFSPLPRVDHIFKSCLFFQSKLLMPLYYIRRDSKKNVKSIGGG